MRPPTPKERAFCHAFVETGSLTEAHARGYPGHSRRKSRSSAARRVLARPAVQAYLATLYRAHRETHADTLRRVVAEYERIAFADLGIALEAGGDGLMRIDPQRLSPALAAAVQELSQEEAVTGEGKNARTVRKLRVKLLSKLAALEALTKCLGLVRDEAGKPTGAAGGEEQIDPAVEAIIDAILHGDTDPGANGGP